MTKVQSSLKKKRNRTRQPGGNCEFIYIMRGLPSVNIEIAILFDSSKRLLDILHFGHAE